MPITVAAGIWTQVLLPASKGLFLTIFLYSLPVYAATLCAEDFLGTNKWLEAFSFLISNRSLLQRRHIGQFHPKKGPGCSKWGVLYLISSRMSLKNSFFIGKLHFLCERTFTGELTSAHCPQAPDIHITTCKQWEVCFPFKKFILLGSHYCRVDHESYLVWWMNEFKPGPCPQRSKIPNDAFSQRHCLHTMPISLERGVLFGKWRYYFQKKSFSFRFYNILIFCFNFNVKCQ